MGESPYTQMHLHANLTRGNLAFDLNNDNQDNDGLGFHYEQEGGE